MSPNDAGGVRTKSKAGQASQARLERTRLQNRLSQQHHRARKRAEIHHLQLVEAALADADANVAAEGHSGGERSRQDLLTEIKLLTDGLLRLRRSLLSISSSSTVAAGKLVIYLPRAP